MISEELIRYLNDLQVNNNRDWFHANKTRYQLVRSQFEQYVAQLTGALAQFDPSIKYVTPKESIFRINRDVRFSHDKSPYKTNMGAFICPGGRKTMKSGYYLHIEPGMCFMAVGIYRPPASRLKAIRREIYNEPTEFYDILNDRLFVACFGEMADDQKLKTAPKGYPKDWEYIDLLRYKNYVVSRTLPDEVIVSEDLTETLLKYYKTAYPLHRFINFAIEQCPEESL